MKRFLILVCVVMASVCAQAEEFLVKYRSQKSQYLTLSVMPYQILDHQEKARLQKIKLDPQTQERTLAYLKSLPEVEYVVPNVVFKAFDAPLPVTALQEQWAMAKIKVQDAWSKAGNFGSRSIKIAIIDSGVDYNHPNLAPNIIAGYDFQDNDGDPFDSIGARNNGHGTHCAGVVGATGLIPGGVVGVSPQISIIPIRFLGQNGQGDLNMAVRAIDYAIENGAHVISASWGAAVVREKVLPLLEAIKRADDRGIIFVAAAGNEGINLERTQIFPAASGFPNTITVNATDPSDRKPSWSNFGARYVHLASPGDGIISTLPNNTYGKLSGTSMSAPLVAGFVGYLLAQNSQLSGAQIRALLQATGSRAFTQSACSCRLDALGAVEALVDKKMWTVPFAGTYLHGTSFSLSVINGIAPFRYSSSAPWVAKVSDSGVVILERPGSFYLTVTDATGKSVRTQRFVVLRNTEAPEPTPPAPPPVQPPPTPTPTPTPNPSPQPSPDWPGEKLPPAKESCLLGDPLMCQVICAVQPKATLCE